MDRKCRSRARSVSGEPGPHHRWQQRGRRTRTVEGGGPAVRGGTLATGGNDEPVRVPDLAVKVGFVQTDTPDHFVDGAQLADGELLAAERGSYRGELQLIPGQLDGVAQDRVVVEGKA